VVQNFQCLELAKQVNYASAIVIQWSSPTCRSKRECELLGFDLEAISRIQVEDHVPWAMSVDSFPRYSNLLCNLLIKRGKMWKWECGVR
jgi:hypothetical protein